MPFTAAHPAAVVYLQRLPWKLSGIALVAGSIAPDMEFYLRLRAHAIGAASLWTQVLIGTLLCLAWQWKLRQLCAEIMPAVLVRRFGIGAPADFISQALKRPLSHFLALLAGIFSHWAWDSFTHHDGLCIQWFPVLDQQWQLPFTDEPVRVFFLLQILSSIVGIGLLLNYRHTPGTERHTGPLAMPSKRKKWRTRGLFILTWAGVLWISAGMLPASRFIWDDVFHVLGAGLYALILLALFMFLVENSGHSLVVGAGNPEKVRKS